MIRSRAVTPISYDAASLLKLYAQDLTESNRVMLMRYGFLFVFCFVAPWLGRFVARVVRGERLQASANVIVTIVVFLAAMILGYRGGLMTGGEFGNEKAHRVWLLPLYALAALFAGDLIARRALFKINLSQTTRNHIASGLLLFFAPASLMMGASNAPLYYMNYLSAPWFALVVFGSVLIWRNGAFAVRVCALFICVVTVLLIQAQSFSGIMDHPYLARSLYAQTEDLGAVAQRGAGLFVDKETRDMIAAMREAYLRNRTFASQPVLAIWHMPGVVYMMDAVSPGEMWYYDWGDHTERALNYHCATPQGKKQFDGSFVLIFDDLKLSDAQLAAMRKCGINFPTDYQRVSSSLWNHYTTNHITVSLWAMR
jgi:hypothetical protein